MRLTDTHCHLYFDSFSEDLQAVLERARRAGVERFLVPAIDLETSRAALSLAQAEEDVFAAVGVHPNDAAAWEDAWLEPLREMAARPEVAAVGEIGLDYYRDYTPPAIQRRAFLRQLELAADLGLPVVIHSRNARGSAQAVDDILDLLRDFLARRGADVPALEGRRGVLHSFSGSAAQAQRAIKMGFYIGITGPVTFKNAPDLQSVVRLLPPERLLIETDAPFLSPHPLRGRRNEPERVRLIAEKIAELKGLPPETVAETTTRNAARLFQWSVLD